MEWVNVSFSGSMMPSWTADEDAINYKGKKYPYTELNTPIKIFSKGSFGTNGVLQVFLDGKLANLTFKGKQYPMIEQFVEYANNLIDKYKGVADGAIYNLTGARGRALKVYEDKAIIKVSVTLGSLLTSNATDGAKTIYYSDVIGVQYKECATTLGYLQLETASQQMNNNNSNFFGENSFTFEANLNAKMAEVSKYVQERVEYYKSLRNHPQQVVQSHSNADELLKYKELLDMGALTQEEFEAKKKDLLNL